MKTSIKQSIEDAGGVAAIAALFGISAVSVYEWISRGWVPAEKCPKIERFTNGRVRCERLNARVDWAYLRSAPQPNQVDPE